MDTSDPKHLIRVLCRITKKQKEMNWVNIDSVEILVARTRSTELDS